MNKRERMNYRNIKKKIKRYKTLSIFVVIIFCRGILQAKTNDSLPSLQEATLQNCIQYAIQHNPDIQNAKINQDITETIIKSKLADWYPQVNFNYNVQHNFKLPTLNFNGNIVHTGTENTSGADFGVTQNIFNRDVLLASRTSKDVRLAASQNTKEQKINLAVEVSKAFYDIILTVQQVKVIEEDIVRTNQSLKDAYYQYQAGIVDKTDYKRATIALNNAKAQQKSGEESLKAKNAALKALMGYPGTKLLDLSYDTTQMENEIYFDTTQIV
ncbi:MAG: TolC family protein, partial [Ginsengibacter sp.]